MVSLSHVHSKSIQGTMAHHLCWESHQLSLPLPSRNLLSTEVSLSAGDHAYMFNLIWIILCGSTPPTDALAVQDNWKSPTQCQGVLVWNYHSRGRGPAPSFYTWVVLSDYSHPMPLAVPRPKHHSYILFLRINSKRTRAYLGEKHNTKNKTWQFGKSRVRQGKFSSFLL